MVVFSGFGGVLDGWIRRDVLGLEGSPVAGFREVDAVGDGWFRRQHFLVWWWWWWREKRRRESGNWGEEVKKFWRR